jgi:hypothetical protein
MKRDIDTQAAAMAFIKGDFSGDTAKELKTKISKGGWISPVVLFNKGTVDLSTLIKVAFPSNSGATQIGIWHREFDKDGETVRDTFMILKRNKAQVGSSHCSYSSDTVSMNIFTVKP